VAEALRGGPLIAATLAMQIGETKGARLNKLLYAMEREGQIRNLQQSPQKWMLA
jgi:hypothetical protein